MASRVDQESSERTNDDEHAAESNALPPREVPHDAGHKTENERPDQSPSECRPSSLRAESGTDDDDDGGSSDGIQNEESGTVSLAESEPTATELSRAHRARLASIGLIGRRKEMRVIQNSIDSVFRSAGDQHAAGTLSALSAMSHEPSAMPEVRVSGSQEQSTHTRRAVSMNNVKARSLVVIEGDSGVGKSALALHFRQHCEERNGMFVYVKCDACPNDESPLSTVEAVVNDLCRQILDLPWQTDNNQTTEAAAQNVDSNCSTDRSKYHADDPRTFQKTRNRILACMNDDEQTTMAELAPLFGRIIDESSVNVGEVGGNGSQQYPVDSTDTRIAAARNRVHSPAASIRSLRSFYKRVFASQQFLKAVCDVHPIVIVIDDVQWIDSVSLRILEYWLLDTSLSTIVFVACHCTSPSVDDTANHRASQTAMVPDRTRSFDSQRRTFSQLIATLQERKRERHLKIQKITVESFELQHVHAYVVAALFPMEEAHNFAKQLLQDTAGNVYFIRQIIQSLIRSKQLTFDAGTNKWKWCPQKLGSNSVAPASQVTSNLPTTGTWKVPALAFIPMLHQEIQTIEHAHLILSIAAFVGSTFTTGSIAEIIHLLSTSAEHASFYQTVFQPKKACFREKDINTVLLRCEADSLVSCYGVDWHTPQDRCIHDSQTDDSPTPTGSGERERSPERAVDRPNSPGALFHGVNQRQSKTANMRFSFAHNIIYEASTSLVPAACLEELRFRIGDILLTNTPKNTTNLKVSFTANLVNIRHSLVPMTEEGMASRTMMATLNYTAGLESMRRFAFGLALHYFRVAIDLLQKPKHWNTHLELCIDLFSFAAKCAYATNSTDLVYKYCASIVGLPCSIGHKLRACCILIDSELNYDQDKARNEESTSTSDGSTSTIIRHNAMDLCLSVLNQAGCRFPKSGVRRKLSSFRTTVKIKRTAKVWKNISISNLKVVESDALIPGGNSVDRQLENHLCIMKLLDKLLDIAAVKDTSLVPLIAAESARRTTDRGITPDSPPLFAEQGLVICSGASNFDSSTEFGENALRMVNRLDDRSSESRTILAAYSKVLHWTESLEGIKQPLLDGYRIGMASGDVNSAAWNAYFYTLACLYTGTLLCAIEADVSTFCRAMQDFHQTTQYKVSSMTWQTVMNLTGASDFQTKLVGDAFDERKRRDLPKEHHQLYLTFCWNKLYTAVIFNDYTAAANTALQIANVWHKQFPGNFLQPVFCFFAGLSCFAATSTSNDASNGIGQSMSIMQQSQLTRQYRQMGRKFLNRLKTWQGKGSPNCIHYVQILSAENDLSQGSYAKAVASYKMSIESAKGRGFVQDQAIATERLALCLRNQVKSARGADEMYAQAIKLFEQWGADGKVQQMCEHRADLFQS